jgi:hypothetical protein
MSKDAKRSLFLVIRLFAKVHLNCLIAKSFNNIGRPRVLAIVKPFAWLQLANPTTEQQDQLLAQESQLPLWPFCKL